MGFRYICHFFLDLYTLYVFEKRISFDSCLFLLLCGPLNVIRVLKFAVYNKEKCPNVTAPKGRVHHWQELLLLVTKLH